MSFDNNKWGVCTLHSKTPYLKNPQHFIEYKFTLPNNKNNMPLHLGQGLLFSLLDNNDNVVTADFYLNSPRHSNGHVTMMLPKIDQNDHDVLSYTCGNKERLDMVSFNSKKVFLLPNRITYIHKSITKRREY